MIAIICVAGLSALSVLPRMEDPILSPRFGIVRTIFPGANAERVETQITKPLEDRVAVIDGIKSVTSTSAPSISSLTIELESNVSDSDKVWTEVRDALTETEKLMPRGSRSPDLEIPNMRSFAIILGLRWAAQDTPADFKILQDEADRLEEIMRSIYGTEIISQFGDRDETILIQVDQAKASEQGVTIGQLANQLTQNETIGIAGKFRGGDTDLAVELSRGFDSIEDLGASTIRLSNQQSMRLDELSTISRTSSTPPDSIAIVDGDQAIVIGATIRKQIRIDQWTDEINAKLEIYQEALPEQVKLDNIFSQNKYVEQRLKSLVTNLLVGTAAVVLVVFILMGWQSMVVVGITLPLTVMIVLAGMRLMGIPIHQMSVTGLIIALGLLIDNAIVIVDEVSAKLRNGESPLAAIKTTIYQLRLPLLGSTLTTTLSFLPIALLPGSSGEFVGSIAISVILAINASFFLSMTVVPALTILLRGNKIREKRANWLVSFLENGLYNEYLAKLYRSLLVQFFRAPILGVIVGLSLPILGFILINKLPKQFFPPSERDQVHIQVELASSTSIAKTEAICEQISSSVKELIEFERLDWFIGESAPSFYYNMVSIRKNSPHYAQAYLELPSGNTINELIQKIQQHLGSNFPEARILVRKLEQGPPVISPIKIELFGSDLDKLREFGDEIRLIMSQTPDIVYTKADLSEQIPTLNFAIDQEKITNLGLTRRTVEEQLYTSLEGIEVGSLFTKGDQIPIQIRFSDATRSNTENIANLPILKPPSSSSPAPSITSLASFGQLNLVSKRAQVSHIERQRVNVIRGYVTPGALPSVVEKDLRERIDASITKKLPDGYYIDWGGEPEKRKRAVAHLMAHLPMLAILMIVTLVASFRSFRIALIIGLVAILSIGLGLGSLWVFQYPFGFMGVVGSMGLLGIAVNDAIVVMAGIHHDDQAKQGDPEALADVIFRRTRHIIATTVTTMAGFTPLILAGGEFWPPVATTIAGGVLGATILALCFVPCLYLLLRPRFKPQKVEIDNENVTQVSPSPATLPTSEVYSTTSSAQPVNNPLPNKTGVVEQLLVRSKNLSFTLNNCQIEASFPIGCLLVTSGPGKGSVLPLGHGATELSFSSSNSATVSVFRLIDHPVDQFFELEKSGVEPFFLNHTIPIINPILITPNTLIHVDRSSMMVFDFFDLSSDQSVSLKEKIILSPERTFDTITDQSDFATGCLVIVDGPGKGEIIPFGSNQSSIGRGAQNRIKMEFGDEKIANYNALGIAYYPIQNQYFVMPGGADSEVYLNSEIKVTEPTAIHRGDFITVGATTMAMFPFCSAEGWNWQSNHGYGEILNL